MEKPSHAPVYSPLFDNHPESLLHLSLPTMAFAHFPCLSHTLSLLSDSSHKPRGLLVLTTHLDLFSSLIMRRSQLAHPQTPPFCNCGRNAPATRLTPWDHDVCPALLTMLGSCQGEGGEKGMGGESSWLNSGVTCIRSSLSLLPT